MGRLMVGVARFLPLCAVVLLIPALAASQPPPPPPPPQATVTLDTDHGPVGTEVRAEGKGWPASTTVEIYVEIYFESQFLGEAVSTDARGEFTTTFIVPYRPPGLYPVFFTDGKANFAPYFTITGPDQGPTCKPAAFIGLRGTGEPATKGSLGDTVWAFYDKFKAAYGRTNVDVHGVPYPAISPNLTINCDVSGCNVAQLPDKLFSWLLELGPSVDDGAAKLHAILAAQHARCPDQQFVIVGYSQGAWATGEALVDLSPSLLSRVAAVVLLGDPKLWWRDPDYEGVATKEFFPGLWGPREPRYMPDVTDWDISPSRSGAFQFRSYCMGQDPFCNATRFTPQEWWSEGSSEWAWWLWNCQQEDSRNPQDCQHFMYDKGSLPAEVASWFVERLSQSPPSSPLPKITLSLNQTSFQRGDTHVLTAAITPGDSASSVDVYLALQLPDQTLLFYQANGSFTQAAQPLVANWTVTPFSGEIFRYAFSGAEPAGTYTWYAAFTDPRTLNFIGDIAQAPFNVTVLTVPADPSEISVFMTSGGHGIGVSWKDNSNNELGFDNFNGIMHLQVYPNQTFISSDWGGLSSGQYMCFQVSAYNAAGYSAPTPWGCITVP
jgi:Cutinase